VADTPPQETEHVHAGTLRPRLESLDWQVAQDFEANFRWEYQDGRDKLLNLYRKGSASSGTPTRASTGRRTSSREPAGLPDEMIAIFGSPTWQRLDAKRRTELRHHIQSWQLSQFLHGSRARWSAREMCSRCRAWTPSSTPHAGDGRGTARRGVLAPAAREVRARLPDHPHCAR